MLDTQKMIKDILDKLHPSAVAHLASGGFLSNLFTNPAQALTPQNGYQASVDPGAQTDFSGAQGYGTGIIGQGLGNSQYGVNGITAANGSLNATAAKQAGLSSSLGGVLAQQKGLAGQLQQQANGAGPNPAQAQFGQNVDQAAQQAAGTIESTKGINPALAAQLAMRQQSGAGQAAAGQAATLQAQQQLAAQQQLGAQQQAMAGTIGAQGQALAGAAGTYGTAGGLSAQQGNIGANQANIGSGLYGTAVNGQLGQNSNNINAQLGASGLNQKTASQNTQNTADTNSNLFNSLSSAGASLAGGLFAEGGDVGHMAAGGDVGLSPMVQQILGNAGMVGGDVGIGKIGAPKPPAPLAPTSATPGGYAGADVGPAATGMGDGAAAASAAGGGGAEALLPLVAMAADGGEMGKEADDKVPAKYDDKAMSMAQALMAKGGQVPGKPAHPGNDYRNDVVPTVLSKGEIVLPNEVTESDHPAEMAAKFVEALKSKAHPTYGRVLQARAALAKAQASHKAAGGLC